MVNENEFYLASFPRSGNTWVRFLIANVYNNIKKEFSEVDFFNIHDIIPELKPGETVSPWFKDLPPVFKTHAKFTASFENTILILRNPFDTIYSYHDFLNKNKGIEISLSETVTHAKYGIAALVEHTDSFIKNCDNLLIITYENLHSRPFKELKKICDFIGLEAADETIRQSIEKSSFHSMREIETRKGRKFGKNNFKFIRSGQLDEGEEVIKNDYELYGYIVGEIKKSPLLYLLYV